MVESLTKNYNWTKPEVTKSPSTWGGFLNTDLDSINSIVFSNQQGIVPIGAVTMFAGATAPSNWLICDGSSLDTTAYAALFAVIGHIYGGSGANFNLPNMGAQFPIGVGTNLQGVGASLGEAYGSFSATIGVANLPPHAHPIVDVAHNHGAAQYGHSHTIATGGHSHNITTGGHNHTVPNNTVLGSGSGLTPGGPSFSLQGNTATSTAGNLGGSTDTAGNLGGGTDAQTPGIVVNASGTGLSTTQNAGSGAAMSIVPPFVALNFIIRFA